MRLKSLLLFATVFSVPFSAFAAEQQRDLQSGLNYTTFGYENDEKKTNQKTDEQQKTEEPDAPKLPAVPKKNAIAKPQKPTLAPQLDPEEEQSAEVRIWTKYKALASGQSKNPTEDTAKEEGETKLEKADTPATESEEMKGAMKSWHAPETEEKAQEEEPKQASGISAILNEWQTSKNQQREMRTKHFEVPVGIGTSKKEKTDEKRQEKPEETPEKP
jgi:hypothetical protein